MSAFFFESPIWIVLCGGFIVAVAAYFWSQTGNRAAAYTAIGSLALTVILAMVNVQVVTTRESVAKLLDEVAAELRVNNFEAVYSYIHPDAQPVIQQAKSELSNFKFFEAKITRIKDIAVNDSTNPRTVVAQFNAFAELETQGHKVSVPRFVKVTFSEDNGQWLVTGYEHFEPAQGFKRDP